MSTFNFHCKVEESTRDLRQLRLGEVYEQRQDCLCQVDELFHESLLLEDSGKFVDSSLLSTDCIVVEVVLVGDFLLNNLL